MHAPTADLRVKLAENPGVVFEDAAREHHITPRAVLEAMPNAMRKFAPGAGFIEAMNDIATWGDITLIVNTEDGIMEFSGPIPKGDVARGYFNLMGRTGFHGHLRHERCAGIAFLERTFMGRPSATVLFLNPEGGFMFKVFVGRDEKNALRQDQVEKMRALADRLGAT
jgi:heme iron utilization protein